MYTAGDAIYDYTSNGILSREILDQRGMVICYVIEAYKNTHATTLLLEHLNRDIAQK